MNPAVVLWLALLQAFSLATASTAVRRDNVGGRLVTHVATSTARGIGTTADVPVPDVRVPLRVPLRAARADVRRATSPVSHGKGPSVLTWDHTRRPLPASFLRQLRHQRASATHRLSSRGTLLPYFPTAPPRKA